MLKLIFAFLFVSSAFAAHHVMKTPGELEWKEGPESLPPGAQMAVITGSPKAKGPFVMRLKFPANYQIPAHFHSKDENVTVIEGTFNMGEGDKLDAMKSHSMPVGSYMLMPMKTHHYAFTKDQQVIVQLNGMGPFDITYMNPQEDPRKKKE